jgi:hypothetical protein
MVITLLMAYLAVGVLAVLSSLIAVRPHAYWRHILIYSLCIFLGWPLFLFIGASMAYFDAEDRNYDW